jgi:hypothetical protein
MKEAEDFKIGRNINNKVRFADDMAMRYCS